MKLSEIFLTLIMAMGFGGSVLFLISYHHKSEGRWTRYPVRRHLMAFAASLGAVFGTFLYSLVWPVNIWVWNLFLGLVVLTVIHRNVLLFTNSRRSRDHGRDSASMGDTLELPTRHDRR